MYKFNECQIQEINYSGGIGNSKHPDVTCASRIKHVYQKTPMSALE